MHLVGPKMLPSLPPIVDALKAMEELIKKKKGKEVMVACE